MIRGVSSGGQRVLVGITRSSLELLLKGESLLSPAFEGPGPDIVIIFAEDDRGLRERLRGEGRVGPLTVEHDRRSS